MLPRPRLWKRPRHTRRPQARRRARQRPKRPLQKPEPRQGRRWPAPGLHNLKLPACYSMHQGLHT